MSLPQVARRYARALYEVAVETAQLPAVENDMKTLSDLLMELPELGAWCRGGHAHLATALTFVRSALIPLVGPATGNALRLAAEHDRLAAIPLLPSAFEAEAQQNGTLKVTLEAAQPVECELVALVESALRTRTGRAPVVAVTIVPELIAGFRVFWDDRLVDRSAQGRLRVLRSRLTRQGGGA